MPLTDSEMERFRRYQSQEGDCLVWTGHRDKDGYGNFQLRRQGRRAHRVAYFHAFGPIPDGCVVHHTCGNRACVNVGHLRLATAKDNALRESRSPAALNRRKVHCPKGHPYDRKYGKQRYCSVCQAAKTKRLRSKWNAERGRFTGC